MVMRVKRAFLLFFLLQCILIKSNAQQAWWNNTVAYEIFVRSFYDTNADGRGDFNGLTAKLDYLNDGNPYTNQDLGVGLIWLMPTNASPSYHGYDVTNYNIINPQYGNTADFKRFVDSAHSRGIKVILDFVINHTSSQHPWFIKSAANDPQYRNFYRWETNPPNQTGPWGQQVWYTKNSSKYYALFWSEMPDLNYAHKPVRDSIFAAAKYWLNAMDVDGFRLDAAMYLYENGNVLKNDPRTITFWKEFNDSCEVWKQNSLLVGEVWDAPEVVALYKDALDLCFDFNLADKNLSSVNSSNPFDARVALKNTTTTFNNQFATFLTNHDQDRVIMLVTILKKTKPQHPYY
jgi:alpha-amylase